MYKIRGQRGFSAVEALLIIIILGILGFTGWFVYHAQKSTDTSLNAANQAAQNNTEAIANFAQCMQAKGSKFQQTYPETCVTKSGKSFTNTAASPQKYLVIKEWGVALPLSADIADANYARIAKSVDPQSETVGLSTPGAAASSADCAANAMGLAALIRQTAAVHDANYGKPNTQADPHPVYPKKIGSYYYQYHGETGVAPTAAHPDGPCGDYKSGLAYANSFKAAFDHMVSAAN
jgi:hypothetical protein